MRAGYPDVLFDDLATLVAPGGSMLEGGCGTGKATIGFATRALDIVAIDPGPAMISEAKANLASFPNVSFVTSTFEDWMPGRHGFELVASAQAWHWVPPEIGFPKAADLLTPGGALAIFGNDWEPADSVFREEIDAVYRRMAPHLRDSPLAFWYRADGPLPDLITGSGRFAAPRYRGFSWSRTLRTGGYLDMLRTLSSHQGLGEEKLDELIRAVALVAQRFGGEVELSYTTHLHLSRRL